MAGKISLLSHTLPQTIIFIIILIATIARNNETRATTLPLPPLQQHIHNIERTLHIMSNSFTISLPEDLAKHFITYRDDIMNPETLDFLIKFGFIETAIYDTSLASITKKPKSGVKMTAVRLRTAIKYPNHFIAIAVRFHMMIVSSGLTVEEFIARESTENNTITTIKTSYDKAVTEFKRKKLFKTKPVRAAGKTKRKVGPRSGESVSKSKSDKSRQLLVSCRESVNQNALLFYAVEYVDKIIAPSGKKTDPEKFKLRADLLRRAHEYNVKHPEEVKSFMASATNYQIKDIINDADRKKAERLIADTRRGGFWTYVEKEYTDERSQRNADFYSLYLVVPGLLEEVCEYIRNKPEEE